MKTVIALTLLLFATNSAFAKSETKLLDCNLPAGAQQVTVVQRDGKLILKTLSEYGALSERALTQAEWDKKTIIVDIEDSGKATLKLEDGDWSYKIAEPGFNYFGYADCE